MPKWCMACKGRVPYTGGLNPSKLGDRRKLESIRIVVCGRCWRESTWEY